MRLLCIGILLLLGSCCRLTQSARPAMQTHALRLRPGQDLKRSLDEFARAQGLQAGFVLTCVGSLRKAVLRPANQTQPWVREQKFEIVSLVGTLSPDGSHLHVSLSDSTGAAFGGHLLEGCEIYTTAEIVLGEATQLRFRRELDAQTTFKELVVEKKR
ncbi:MAG TPA: DNA-binding protein [Saprospiraceae bacterium]|nr:DNA-binding protein [Saprospiraceae bacterium]HND87583.1 DNA-binding protein [Saprospiraceae bacterium]